MKNIILSSHSMEFVYHDSFEFHPSKVIIWILFEVFFQKFLINLTLFIMFVFHFLNGDIILKLNIKLQIYKPKINESLREKVLYLGFSNNIIAKKNT
jgi:hypothetical protein